MTPKALIARPILPLERGYRWARDRALGAPVLGWAVRRLRARAVERAYANCVDKYRLVAETGSDVEAVLQRRAGDRLRRLRSMGRPPRVLFVGTDELQDRAGILQGLGTVADVVPFVQQDGTYGQLTRDNHLSFDLAEPIGHRILELTGGAAAAGKPFDLIIGQMWDGYVDPTALSQASDRYGVVVVNIAMDDRHAFEVRKLGRTVGTRGLIPHIDLAATAAPEAVDWYFAEGCPAVFLPEASDPELFRPMPSLPKRWDVSFVGARYGIRERLVRRLDKAGVAIEARGSGWPAGRISITEMPRLFAQSKIVLGVGTIGHSERLYALKMRDFDGPMSGSCYVTHANPDLALVFDVGREIAVYRDDEDCLRVIRALLDDKEQREEIAHLGRLRAARDHTWRRRFQSLLVVLMGASGATRASG